MSLLGHFRIVKRVLELDNCSNQLDAVDDLETFDPDYTSASATVIPSVPAWSAIAGHQRCNTFPARSKLQANLHGLGCR